MTIEKLKRAAWAAVILAVFVSPWAPAPISAAMASEAVSASAAAEDAPRHVIHLRGGASVTGELLRQRADRVVLDLGFTVLSIPAEEVQRIEPLGGEPEVLEATDLYQVARSRDELAVKENVDRCGASVLQVQTTVGLGSGFVISEDGYVVTAHHVIAGEHKITLTLFQANERELQRVQFEKVRIVATQPEADLALLKIEDLDGRKLPVVPLGDSGGLLQGQSVFSIGSPLGLDRTVSEGIVSLKNRPMGGRLYIQSTTQINSGNSGGPLFNLRGEVVGVNNMKLAAVGVEGMSFAVPSSTLKNFLRNRDAFAFNVRNPNSGFRYHAPPTP